MSLLREARQGILNPYLETGLGNLVDFEVKNMKRILAFPLIALGLLAMAACTDDAGTDQPVGMESPPVDTAPAPAE